MKNTSIRRASKSKLCDSKNEQEGSPKKSEALLQSEAQNDGQGNERPRVLKDTALHIADRRKGMREEENNQCLDISISFQAVEDSLWQQSNLGGRVSGVNPHTRKPTEQYRQLSLWKSTPTLNSSCDWLRQRGAHRTSQESQFTPISETTTQSQENLTSSRWDSPAQARVMQELEQDYLTQSQHFGEKDLDALLRLNPNSVLSNNLKELSDEDFELFLADSVWQDTITKLKQSRQQSLGRVIKDEGFLLFPTLTSGASTQRSRPAGQTKCDRWFKDNGLIPNGSQLGTKAIALTMGFPSNWFMDLTNQHLKSATIPSQVKHQDALEQDISQDEQLHQDKQPLHSVESSISIPCLVKQPNQPEVKGIIKKDLGDCEASRRHRFLVDISDELITVSKLFVYPDFSKTVGQINKIPPSKKISPPSKNSEGVSVNLLHAVDRPKPTKTRRKKGDGTGYIYRRTITRRGKEYQESYFRYRDESGKLRSKYIPQKLIDEVQEAESQKKPIADILFLLGGDEINRGEQSNNVPWQTWQTPEKSDELISISRGEQLTPPSTRKRKQGDGTGYIECKPIQRSGKKYQQYWYHYEEWREGDRLSKKSKYIPSRMRSQIEKMNNEKVPVEEILKILRNRKSNIR